MFSLDQGYLRAATLRRVCSDMTLAGPALGPS